MTTTKTTTKTTTNPKTPMTTITTLADDLLLGLDAVRFAEAAGYVLDDWQRKVLDAQPRRLLLNCSRRPANPSWRACSRCTRPSTSPAHSSSCAPSPSVKPLRWCACAVTST